MIAFPFPFSPFRPSLASTAKGFPLKKSLKLGMLLSLLPLFAPLTSLKHYPSFFPSSMKARVPFLPLSGRQRLFPGNASKSAHPPLSLLSPSSENLEAPRLRHFSLFGRQPNTRLPLLFESFSSYTEGSLLPVKRHCLLFFSFNFRLNGKERRQSPPFFSS